MKRAPMFDVMMMMVFLKFTRLPRPIGEMAVLEHLQQDVEDVGVRLLDSSSRHDRIRVALHLLRQLTALFVADVSGGEPISLLTECFSMYSDMSKRISAWRCRKGSSASARASSVLPTPVGPRNTKLPTGRAGFLSPARERRIAREIAEIAFSG